MDVKTVDYKALLKEKTGICLDELYEGYAFKRKEGRMFIFENEDQEHELAFTMSTVQDSFYQRVQEERITDLQNQLDELGIYKLSFDLPGLALEDPSVINFKVDAIDENHQFVQLKDQQGELKRIHLSQLYDLQTDQLISELKEIEDGFWSLSLGYVLSRVHHLHTQIFHIQNESNRRAHSHLVLSRLRILVLERAEQGKDELSDLNLDELNILSDVLEKGLQNTALGQFRLIQRFVGQKSKIERRKTLLQDHDILAKLNEQYFISLFEPLNLKYELINAILESNQLASFLEDKAHALYDLIGELSSLSLKRKLHSNLSINDFVMFLFNLQDQFINTQLRVGRHDHSLIQRFRVKSFTSKLTLPILEDYDGITRQERVTIYKELVEYRLNLMFAYQLHDQQLKQNAHYNVHDFYDLFYKMTNQA